LKFVLRSGALLRVVSRKRILRIDVPIM
jgi:hypothetical protein